MTKGFIYVVDSASDGYQQASFCNVPTESAGRLYFGPCKRSMRPRMHPGDFVFGLSPAKAGKRRFLFAASLQEKMTFQEAYHRFPDLRGPDGPIHVRPVNRNGAFPHCSYDHIPKAMHPSDWDRDLRDESLDAFFVCHSAVGWQGTWLGPRGPLVDDAILEFLRTCEVHGRSGLLRPRNDQATLGNPVAHGGLHVGLHLETVRPHVLSGLLNARLRNTKGESQPTSAVAGGRNARCVSERCGRG